MTIENRNPDDRSYAVNKNNIKIQSENDIFIVLLHVQIVIL
jgi:hypothetical protein